MAEIMYEAGNCAYLGINRMNAKIRVRSIQAKRNGLGNLSHLKGMCQSVSEKIGLVAREKLRLTLKASKTWTMDYAGEITLNLRSPCVERVTLIEFALPVALTVKGA
jgi:hypothetical protein